MWASAPCPICGIEFEGAIHCGKDDLVYVATYGDPQPEGYPMTLERWHELNPGIDTLYGRSLTVRDDSDDASHVAWQAAKADAERGNE
jgi:hypothetical protein